MEAVKVKEGYHICPSCKVAQVKDDFKLCFGCERKWWKVYDSCVGAGWPEDLARCRADDYYPGRGKYYPSKEARAG